MLYSLYETQHAALAPMRFWADLSQAWLHQPAAEKPRWNIADARIEVALAKPFCRLLHFKQATPKAHKVLLVPPFAGHHATLARDTVRALLPEHELWVADWSDARCVPRAAGPFHLADYVDYVREWIRFLSPNLNVIALGQAGVPVLAAVALMAARRENDVPHTMILAGAPIDARRNPASAENLAATQPFSWFQRALIHRVPATYPGYMRRVYPGFLQHVGFMAMPPDRHFVTGWAHCERLLRGDGDSPEAHRRFYDEFSAVLDLPAEYYLDTVKTVYQDFALPKGRMFVREELVIPQAIRETALLTIEGELDDVSGHGETEAAHALCRNIPPERREHFIATGVGHFGIFSGRRWRELVFPMVRNFIRRHAQSRPRLLPRLFAV